MTWIKRIKVESIQANKSKLLAFSGKLFALCAEKGEWDEKHIKINTAYLTISATGSEGLAVLTPARICTSCRAIFTIFVAFVHILFIYFFVFLSFSRQKK